MISYINIITRFTININVIMKLMIDFTKALPRNCPCKIQRALGWCWSCWESAARSLEAATGVAEQLAGPW